VLLARKNEGLAPRAPCVVSTIENGKKHPEPRDHHGLKVLPSDLFSGFTFDVLRKLKL
jgi:hypothetical protein